MQDSITKHYISREKGKGKKQEKKKEKEKIKLPRIHANNPEYRVNSNNKIIIEKKSNNLFSKLTKS